MNQAAFLSVIKFDKLANFSGLCGQPTFAFDAPCHTLGDRLSA